MATHASLSKRHYVKMVDGLAELQQEVMYIKLLVLRSASSAYTLGFGTHQELLEAASEELSKAHLALSHAYTLLMKTERISE